jgi:CDGSH-type Zn-finger protein
VYGSTSRKCDQPAATFQGINMTNLIAPKVAQKEPYMVELEAGKQYSWCSCGFSKAQPFCDGSHKESGTGLKSVKYLATENKTVAFCGCKKTASAPLCNGAHSNL